MVLAEYVRCCGECQPERHRGSRFKCRRCRVVLEPFVFESFIATRVASSATCGWQQRMPVSSGVQADVGCGWSWGKKTSINPVAWLHCRRLALVTRTVVTDACTRMALTLEPIYRCCYRFRHVLGARCHRWRVVLDGCERRSQRCGVWSGQVMGCRGVCCNQMGHGICIVGVPSCCR